MKFSNSKRRKADIKACRLSIFKGTFGTRVGIGKCIWSMVERAVGAIDLSKNNY